MITVKHRLSPLSNKPPPLKCILTNKPPSNKPPSNKPHSNKPHGVNRYITVYIHTRAAHPSMNRIIWLQSPFFIKPFLPNFYSYLQSRKRFAKNKKLRAEITSINFSVSAHFLFWRCKGL